MRHGTEAGKGRWGGAQAIPPTAGLELYPVQKTPQAAEGSQPASGNSDQVPFWCVESKPEEGQAGCGGGERDWERPGEMMGWGTLRVVSVQDEKSQMWSRWDGIESLEATTATKFIEHLL